MESLVGDRNGPPARPRRAMRLPWLGWIAVALIGWGCAQQAEDYPVLDEPTSALRPEALGGSVLSEARITDYDLTAHLDTETHRVTGTARVVWRNKTEQTVSTLPFHLYMNGFRAEDTAWMSNSRGRHRRSIQDADGPWGYIDIHSVSLEAGPADPESGAAESQPLTWRENDDPSTMTVDLPDEVGPGQSVEVLLEFTTQLPKVLARTGFGGDFHAVAQWFPKLGVLDEDGWQAHTFTPNDEFYSSFGHYRAELDVPSEVLVGATGIRVGETDLGDGRKRLIYEAEMVHDFVWMTDPNFVIVDAEHKGIRIRNLIQPELADTAMEHTEVTIAALDSYERRYGPYPWSTVTIVHPPEEAAGAGGMEYPTLFTSNDRRTSPDWFRRNVLDERMSGLYTTVHEFGHQYFQGLFASREHEQPWLDEGLNSMSNILAYVDGFEDPWLLKLGGQKLYHRDIFGLITGSRRASLIPVDSPASAFDEVPGSYGLTIYQKTAGLMLTLRHLIGEEAFDEVFREYGRRARFRHPTGEDLEALFVEMLGPRVPVATDAVGEPVELEFEAYFEQALRTVRQVDFAVGSLIHTRKIGTQGWRRDESGELVGGEEPPDYLDFEIDEMDTSEVLSIVRIERVGDFHIPVELEVEFEDGSRELRIWHGNHPYGLFEWQGRRVVRAQVDPSNKLLLERRRLDNMRRYRPDEGDFPDDGLSDSVGDLVEAAGLVLLGGVMP